jgi:dihydrodipicolinate synthase/N-acetylneuraminate lyase
LLFGASGVVPAISNIDPRTLLDIYASALAGNTTGLVRLQERVHKLLAIAALGSPIVCFKTALELMGICRHYTTAPLQPLGPEKREALAATLRELGLL